MSRIIVTGAKGGTGRSIVEVLRGAGHTVIGIDLLPWDGREADYVQLDLRNAAGLNDVFAGADGVVHFGSPPGDTLLSTTEAFHMLTVAGFNVFQAARNVGIRRVAWASSIEVYGNLAAHRVLPITESGPLSAPSIYGASKVLLENLARDFWRWSNMSIAGFRLTRIIYDTPEGKDKLKRFANTQSLGADCLWSYIDARDVATACQAWIESDVEGAEVFNLGADNVHVEVPTRQLLEAHGYDHLQCPAEWGEHQTLFSSEKIRTMLRWQTRFDWKQILGQAESTG